MFTREFLNVIKLPLCCRYIVVTVCVVLSYFIVVLLCALLRVPYCRVGAVGRALGPYGRLRDRPGDVRHADAASASANGGAEEIKLCSTKGVKKATSLRVVVRTKVFVCVLAFVFY